MFLVTSLFFLVVLLSNGFAQLNGPLGYPQLGPVYPVPNNNTALNFTFYYPSMPQYQYATANYTFYDFNTTNITNPIISRSSAGNCSGLAGNEPCFSSLVPPLNFGPGDFVIGCFEWQLFNINGTGLGIVDNCVLSQTTVNFTQIPLPQPVQTINAVMATAIVVSGGFPAPLPYDQVNINSTINGVMAPTMFNSTSNSTFMMVNTFVYQNLISNTAYNVCVTFNFANSIIVQSAAQTILCQTITTLSTTVSSTPSSMVTPSSTPVSSTPSSMVTPSSTPVSSTPSSMVTPSPTTSGSTASSTVTTVSTTAGGNASSMILSNIFLILISMLIVYL